MVYLVYRYIAWRLLDVTLFDFVCWQLSMMFLYFYSTLLYYSKTTVSIWKCLRCRCMHGSGFMQTSIDASDHLTSYGRDTYVIWLWLLCNITWSQFNCNPVYRSLRCRTLYKLPAAHNPSQAQYMPQAVTRGRCITCLRNRAPTYNLLKWHLIMIYRWSWMH